MLTGSLNSARRAGAQALAVIAAIACGAMAVLATAALCIWAPGALAADAPDAHEHHHHHVIPQTARTLAAYTVPEVNLVRDDGKTVQLARELDDGRPVVLSFIYTSCTTVCPMVSHVLADLQSRLGQKRDQVHIMSVSIDPEYDTPARLREYARQLGAGPEWQHYTGTLAASQTAQRAFAVYRGDKMNHAPAVLVRSLPGAQWVRIDGFATADELLAELPGRLAAAK
jgi:protein SCO1